MCVRRGGVCERGKKFCNTDAQHETHAGARAEGQRNSSLLDRLQLALVVLDERVQDDVLRPDLVLAQRRGDVDVQVEGVAHEAQFSHAPCSSAKKKIEPEPAKPGTSATVSPVTPAGKVHAPLLESET